MTTTVLVAQDDLGPIRHHFTHPADAVWAARYFFNTGAALSCRVESTVEIAPDELVES